MAALNNSKSIWHTHCEREVTQRIEFLTSIHYQPLQLVDIKGKARRMNTIPLQRPIMKRIPSFVSFIIVTGFMALFLFLIPNPLTPANSSDIAFLLSSSTLRSSFLGDLTHPQKSFHSDDTLAALTIYLEARGESFAGKLAVAAVIRNRMISKYHSDGSVKGTVLRAKQFEPWIRRNPEDMEFDPTNRKMQESLLAWKLVQDGRKIVDGAVLFYNPLLVKTPRWAQVNRKVAKIGGHEFFNKHAI
jgi:N-acetylmuramoyl-L-alanine amidase